MEGKILQVRAADLNGDRRSDLILVARTGLEPVFQRWIYVFAQTPDGAFTDQARTKHKVGDTVCAFDTADLAGNGSEQLLLLATDGLYAIEAPCSTGGMIKILDYRHALLFPDMSSLPYYDFVSDWKGDGSIWLMVPAFEEIRLVRLEDGKPAGEMEHVQTSIHYGMFASDGRGRGLSGMSIKSEATFPELMLDEFDGDGNVDLFAAFGERMWVHRQDAQKRYSVEPDEKFLFQIKTEQEKVFRNSTARVAVYDLNGDRMADTVVNKFGGSLSKMKSTTHVYMGRSGGGYADAPEFSLDAEGFAGLIYFPDVDGDGKRDLVIPKAGIGVMDIIRALLTKTVSVQYEIYLFQEESIYPEKPDFTRRVTYGVDYRAGITIFGFVPRFDGDFDGDGRLDMFLGTDRDQAQVYLGVEKSEGLFASSPSAEVIVPASLYFDLVDLSGDGLTDFFVYYPLEPSLEGELRVFVNTGGWAPVPKTAPKPEWNG